MNFNKIRNRVSTVYLSDPYSSLMLYKRAFKFISQLKNNSASVLILGSRNHVGIDWKNLFYTEGSDALSRGGINETLILTAGKYYDAILCLDPALYYKHLYQTHLPVIGIATTKELATKPNITKVVDYLLPAPSGKVDAALKQLIMAENLPQSSNLLK
eukprot:GHVL01042678.1.p1 GENE.GHVL01042678.1~~GHVL01042678.1.p1  ORF type:complete len:170 (+),score=31.03 GHVL01042678.1:37-510(+)